MVYFQVEQIKFTLKSKTLIKQWIQAVVKNKKRLLGNVNFIFCSDDYLLAINKQYLNHNTYTDIITFDYSKEVPSKPICGDIFISVDRIKENSEKFNTTFENELHRVIIHGVLHLLGYTDKNKAAKAEMTAQEDVCLKLFTKISK